MAKPSVKSTTARPRTTRSARETPLHWRQCPNITCRSRTELRTPGGTLRGHQRRLNTGFNLFANPCAVYNEFRRPILGRRHGFGRRRDSWLPVLEPGCDVSKDFKATERIGATLSFQFVNILNHFVPADPTTNIDTPSTFGVVPTSSRLRTARRAGRWSLVSDALLG